MHCIRGLLFCLFVTLILSGCTTTSRSSRVHAELADLMTERLTLAREVARSKHRSGTPVYDPARETAILATLTRQATERGLSREDAELFFTAQITASRQVQTELLDRWSRGEPVPAGTALDLQTELRPKLDDVTRRLLDALVISHRINRWKGTAAQVNQTLLSAGFSNETTRLAIAPLERWETASRHKDLRERQHLRTLRLRQPRS
jgi:chorismate mutase